MAEELFSWLFIGATLIFLMINYNLNLSSIYAFMVVLIILTYYIVTDKRLFRWIPLINKKSFINHSIVGVIAAIIFIYIYHNVLTGTSSMSQVFATTVLGESKLVGMIVFGILIAYVETAGFFRKLAQMLLHKLGIRDTDPFTIGGLITMVGVSGIFTLFHLTAKGVTNNPDLIATFIFAMISMFMVLYFKVVWPAIMFHIAINSHSVGLVDYLKLTSPWVILAIVGVWYFMTKKRSSLFLLGDR